MRDHLTDLADQISDVDRIIEVGRKSGSDGKLEITNKWYVHQQLPAFVRPLLGQGELGWTDRNTWDRTIWTCCWTIEPFFLTDFVHCAGKTQFETAMAGLGARVTFEGGIDLKPGLLRGSVAPLERPIASFVESIVTTIIPRNVRNVLEAAAAYGN
jgi:hypothetical protein